jgi:hypothetical protein
MSKHNLENMQTKSRSNRIVTLTFSLTLCVVYILTFYDFGRSYLSEKHMIQSNQDDDSMIWMANALSPVKLNNVPLQNIQTQAHAVTQIHDSQTIAVKRPRMDIMCRTFNGAFFEIMRAVLTLLIFFPREELSTQIVLVFDAENELDHKAAAVLETAYKNIGVKSYFEEPPPANTLTNMQRDEQFSRTQWSNFYSELYSDADFIGIIDSDSEFSFRPSTPHHLLIDWKRPVIHGINVPNRDYSAVRFMIGRDGVGEFMYVFPFVIKREHFALMRNHIVQTTGLATFEQAWFEMQIRFPSSSWGQFLVMGNYLYHFHHDDYAWDVVYSDVSTVQHPCPHLGKNLPMDQNVDLTVRKYHDQMCVQSRNLASECSPMTEDAINMAKFVPFTDYWPIQNSDAAYTNMAAAKTHDGASPRPHQNVFDESIQEIFTNNGDAFWRNSNYIRADRTRKPA